LIKHDWSRLADQVELIECQVGLSVMSSICICRAPCYPCDAMLA